MTASIFLPGSSIGIMGSGQLGRMLAMAGRRMGYRIHIFSPEKNTPAGQLADCEIAASYEDFAAVTAFAKSVDVLTFEFENIPAQTIEWCAPHCAVRPSGDVLHIAQHRLREKQFLREAGLPLPKFHAVNNALELENAMREIGLPAVLKSAAFGYDGKGQRKIQPGESAEEIWKNFECDAAVLEQYVSFEKEISVIVARGLDGEAACYPVCENLHRNHILDLTVVPADISDEAARNAATLAMDIAKKIDLIGLLAVEMFLLPDGKILINEIAPRPHNSGHWSFDACVTSQFEQQLRAICGLPLGSTELLRPAAMANLLGDVWENGEPDWENALSIPNVKLHLYGKAEPRAGRKMGHLVGLGATREQAIQSVQEARERLK